MPTHSIIQVFSGVFYRLVSVIPILLLFMSCSNICVCIPISMLFSKSQQGAVDFIVSVTNLFIANFICKTNCNYMFSVVP
jgi:hypothetical protein